MHEVSISIIFDRDLRFTSRFWGELHEALGIKLNFSIAFHPHTDGQSKRVIQVLEYMLQCCIHKFEGDQVFWKVSLWKKGVMIQKNGKLSPRFIKPYEIIERISPVAYRLALPSKIKKIHNVFHISMLRQYRFDPLNMITSSEIELAGVFVF
ncbi:Retrotransposon gag protein [Gossypium australe]|uniref:Retrotransposon gag protein n=1 Tax=Gossypium australe TaxID=47621 RepID=A0A5B6WRP6_9ROSI|nr:Retrotransposon gag protein [Gossypium australe]